MVARNPFDSELARSNTCYTAPKDGQLVLADGSAASEIAQFIHAQLRALLLDPRFPCAGAKAAINQATYRFGSYPEMATPETTAGVGRDLFTFVQEQTAMWNLGRNFTTFIASFAGPSPRDELHFEELVWRQLQALHEEDAPLHLWDASVGSDPERPDFSFSFAGRAFFIVALHPASSRWARRFGWPTLVFNAHQQFEQLRVTGHFDRFRDVIRQRDHTLQGSINPNLADFGQASEARQYSGRRVEADWVCPFKRHQTPSAGSEAEAEGEKA